MIMKVLALILLLGAAAVVAQAEKDVDNKIQSATEAEVVVARADNDQETPAAEAGDAVMASSDDEDEIPDELIARDVSIASSTSCPTYWMLYGGKCYYFHTGKKSWAAARSYCQGKGGDLARADTSSRNSFITHLTYGVAYVWIGLSDRANERHFHWVGTDEHAEYENWKTGQPDNFEGNEDCVETNWQAPGRWNDRNCATAYRFVCDKDASACTA